jgi:hypothetical protein
MSAFATAALSLAAAGLAVLPLGGDDGKVPLVKWASWKRRPGPGFIQTLINNHPGANIGAICELSGVTVVDIDDFDLLPLMVKRFGDTPLRTHTPSGGVHLWYHSSGESCRNLRKVEGLAVDIKGKGGQVVVPPSVRFNGQYASHCYGFLAGSWDELPRLPTIHGGALAPDCGPAPTRNGATPNAAGPGSMPSRAVKEGYRNNLLFCSLLRDAKGCDDFGSLLDAAERINADFDPPLTAAEVAKTVHSAWRYETSDQNWVGKEQRLFVRVSELKEFGSCPDALLLFLNLMAAHWNRDEFAVSPKAMAREQFIPGWEGPKRYTRARDALLRMGKLIQKYQGGEHQHDPSLFMLGPSVLKGVRSRGPETGPNVTETHSPSLSPSLIQKAYRERVDVTTPNRPVAKVAGARR